MENRYVCVNRPRERCAPAYIKTLFRFIWSFDTQTSIFDESGSRKEYAGFLRFTYTSVSERNVYTVHLFSHSLSLSLSVGFCFSCFPCILFLISSPMYAFPILVLHCKFIYPWIFVTCVRYFTRVFISNKSQKWILLRVFTSRKSLIAFFINTLRFSLENKKEYCILSYFVAFS